ncbi:BTAD domain-containing putative transcriptional regulator [Actinotalea sp. Marseille-Q4924]|uniref:nSTAND1 domain-containing NTPase n=1 Tax=Actinotalea sp. Marseille-Q4924 TaxID=2866571 RepID=UPI001CE45E42|nr:BTAD domain-containing putative transcriptional regulator [Actinotalea sp. Marseille-Q4924]
MSIQVLGPLRVAGVASLSPRERALLAVLVLRAGMSVRADELADALWGDQPPVTWPKQVQASVGRIRRVLGTGRVVTTPAGYRLVLDADAVDARRFEDAVRRGRLHAASGENDRAVVAFARALALWDGTPYPELAGWEPARAEAERLLEARRTAEEDFLEARLAVGEHRGVAADAELAVRVEPLRERRWAALCLAQYRCGRQADALATLRRARLTLADELGVDIGPELAALERDVLRQDPRLGAGERPPPASETCPYKGLAPYDAADHDVFYGRDEEVLGCLDRLSITPLLVLTGPSGSGKSSLLRAGLIATLQRRGHRTALVVPGAHPLATLDAALAGDDEPSVVAVDQMEELFLLQHDRREVEAYCRRLAEVATSGTTVLVAIRADQVSGLRSAAALADLAEQGMHLVSPLTGEALRAAIQGPAVRAGLRLEHGLVDLLLRDVAGQAGALPLLSHALAETWRRRDGSVLTVEAYQETGGIEAAVARSADRLYENLRPEDRQVCRSLLLRLVVPAPGGIATRRRLQLSALGHDVARDRVLAELVGTRLLIEDQGTVEIAHEALVHAWPRLRTWIDEDGAGLRAMRHLVTSAEGWEALGRPASELYRGARLDAALEWRAATRPDLTATEASFLEASSRQRDDEADAAYAALQREARQSRRLRTLLVTAVMLLAVSLVATGVAVVSRSWARDQAAAARDARDEARLAALVNASLKMRSTDRTVAALLAVEAQRRWPGSAGSRSALLGTFVSSPGFLGHTWVGEREGRDHVGEGLAGALLPDGRTAVVALAGSQPVVLDVVTGEIDRRFADVDLPGGPGAVVRVSADGATAVHYTVGYGPTPCTASDDPLAVAPLAARAALPGCATVTTYDVVSGATVQGPTVLTWPSGEMALSPDGRTVALTDGEDGTVLLLEARSGRSVAVVPPLPAPPVREWGRGAVAFSPDGRLFVGSTAGPVREVEPATGRVVRQLPAPPLSSNTNLWVGPDGRVVGTGHQHVVALDGDAGPGDDPLLWTRPVSGNRRSPCPWAAFSAEAGRLWCGSFHGVIEERDLATGELLGRIRTTHFGNVGWMEATADGRELVVFSVGVPAVLRWRLDGSGPVSRLTAPAHVLWDGFDRGSGHLLTAAPYEDEPERFTVWDPASDVAVLDLGDLRRAAWVAPRTVAGLDPDQGALVTLDVATGRRSVLRDVEPAAVGLHPAPDGTIFVIVPDGTVTRVDPATGRLVGPPLPGHGRPMTVTADASLRTVVVTTVGPDVTSLEDDVTVRFDPVSGEMVGPPLTGWFQSAVHDDLLVVARALSIAFYDLDTLELRREVAGAPAEVERLELSADGALLAVTSRDQSVILYDVVTGTRLGDPIPTAAPPEGRAAALREDGRELAVASAAGVVVWDLDPWVMMRAACRLAGRELTAGEWATHLEGYGPRRATCDV